MKRRAIVASLVVVGLGALMWRYLPFPGPAANPVVDLLANRSPWLSEAVRAWHDLAPGVALVIGAAGAHAVDRLWFAWRGESIGATVWRRTAVGRRWFAWIGAVGWRRTAGGRRWFTWIGAVGWRSFAWIGAVGWRSFAWIGAVGWRSFAWIGAVGWRWTVAGWRGGWGFITADRVRVPLVVVALGALMWRYLPFPGPAADPVVGLLADRSPWLYEAVRAWHYLAPGVALVGGWSVVQAVGRVWFASRRRGAGGGELAAWPLKDGAAAPALVLGELHHPVALREVDHPTWLTIPERGLYTGILICGAVGSGKTSACMRPFARQLLSWKATDPERRMAGLVLEVKGDFCYQVRDVLVDAGRGEDYIELGLNGAWSWNPLSAHWLDSYSLAYTIASLINQLFGKGHEPFWQQAYTNLVRWLIELHRMQPGGWVTLQDVYRCTVETDRIDAMIAKLRARIEGQQFVRIAAAAVVEHPKEFGTTGFEAVRGQPGVVQAPDSEALRETLNKLKVSMDVWTEPPTIQAALSDRRRLDAIKRWYEHDWSKLDTKVASTIVEGLSVFLSVFDLPDVADVFCPPAPVVEDADDAARESGSAPGGSVGRQRLPALDEVIESGKVIALNMPAGSNAALARAVGVMLKQSWLQTLLRRPAAMVAEPQRVFRPAMFLCDEYQAFATVGEDDPSGDEKAFALTRQCRLVPIVATQSISSLRAVLGQGEAWRALIQTLRTRIFLALSDDASAQIASGMCGQVARMKASYTVSEQTARASASLLSGAAGGGTGSVGASKAFSEKREPLFHPRDFTILGNCQAIVQPYDGRRSLDATRCYLKPDFLPRNRAYWRAREAGEL